MKRRRFCLMLAAAGTIMATPARAFRLAPVEWRGVALGAPARLILHHEDRAEALALVRSCVAEVARLERVLSLYRVDSALVRLNREGRLDAPPLDLVRLLGEADRYWRISNGAFDPTIQPLWDLHARHFSTPDADPRGPSCDDIERAREHVGWQRVRLGADAVVLRPGMALTLNGIAQGYVTDRVAELLRRAGMRHVLVDMGEIATLGPQADGRAWTVGLPDGATIPVADGALAVTDADGTRFSRFCHHIFDPATGRSALARGPEIRRAATATEADALSTAALVRGS